MRRNFPAAEVEAAVGSAALLWRSIQGGGYATNTSKWSVELSDGRRVFVKVALDDLAAGWLRDEARVYGSLSESFLPALVAWSDADDTTLLAIEDLSGGHWPPPWSPAQIGQVLETLAALHATPPPPALPSLEEMRKHLDGWPGVAADPGPLLTTGVCSREWLAAALPSLAEASAQSTLEGDALLHLDVRSDNLCFIEDRTVLVDWNFASIGNPLIDAVAWAPSLRYEGGPDPWEIVPDSQGLASLIAGYFASSVGLPAPATAPAVRKVQRDQLEVALPWAARELGLPSPG